MVNPFTDETPDEDLAEISEKYSETDLEELKALGYDFDSIKSAVPTLGTSDQGFAASTSSSTSFTAKKTGKLTRSNLPVLEKTFNKNRYNNASETTFQIGPLTYGPEVQDIKILEHKAIEEARGVRTGSDFLVADGTGDADIHVSLLFSGKKQFEKALKPLIALFRISPITSVQNEEIRKAVYTDYTENNVEPPKVELLEDARSALIEAAVSIRVNSVLTALGQPEGTELTFSLWQEAVKLGLVPGGPYALNSQAQYEQFLSTIDLNEADPDTLKDQYNFDDEEFASEVPDLSSYKVDRTGFVPVAFAGLELQTDPNLPEAIIVHLFLKRINVGNYLTDFLQYRDVEGLPTADAKEAFWLNRAIDLYIDRNLPESFVSFDDFGRVAFKFQGEGAELDRFKLSEQLKGFTIGEQEVSNTDNLGRTEAVQINYGIYHKFHFCRLIGEAYPTAQHMGTSSGSLRIAIDTNDPSSYERLHAYKNAADFFVRHVEKFTRFSGWNVDTFLTRLMNFDPQGQSKDAYIEEETPELVDLKRNFYPYRVVTTTDDTLPDLRHIVIEFKETNPEFFEDFGFTVAKGGHNIQVLYDFFCEIFNRAEDVRQGISSSTAADILSTKEGRYDVYAFETFFGYGDPDIKANIFNADTIIAAILEPKTYENSQFTIDNAELQRDIITELLKDQRLTGVLDTLSSDLGLFFDQIGTISLSWSNIEIPEVLANRIINRFFTWEENAPLNFTETALPSETESSVLLIDQSDFATAPAKLRKLISLIGEKSAREELYRYLIEHKEIGFTDEFKERLFSAVIRRNPVPITDKLYDRSGVIKAYHSLAIALEGRGAEFLTEDQLEPMTKQGSNESKIIVGSDGSLATSDELTTAYPDYFYITYEELFDLIGTDFEEENNWKNFAPTFGNMGIINHDPDLFAAGMTDDAVQKAQKQLAVTKNSPVPPSVFFYREDELEQLSTKLDDEYEQWFAKMKSLMVDIPFDIEAIVRDAQGRDTGRSEIPQEIADTLESPSDQVSTRIEKMVRRFQTQDPDAFRNIQRSLVLSQIEHLQATTEYDDLNKLSKLAESGTLPEEFFNEVAWFDGIGANGILVPFVMGRTMNSPIAKYERLTGVAGETIARSIVFPDGDKSAADGAFRDLVAETVRRAASGSLTGITVSDANVEETKAAFLKVTAAQHDNRNDLIKAFPTMRLYLIEDRGPSLIVQDNFYGYHAIQSIDITHDKYDASLAVIRVADPFHLLQGTAFGVGEKGNIEDKIALPTDGQYDEKFLERIKLRQGRAIQIRGGYSADPDNLDILFTGRIAEIQPGDVITIVAQGWKAELMGKQVEFELQTVDNSSVADLVIRTVRDAKPYGIGEVYTGEEYNIISKIAGNLSAAEAAAHAAINTRSTHGGGGAAGASFDILGFTVISGVDAGLDFRLKNIWIPDDNKDRFRFFKDATKHGWQGAHWVVPLSPAWDVLQNATNYVWGYICQVVPYDGQATLFFGRPEQLYYYTGGKRNIGKAFREIRQRSVNDMKQNWHPVIQEFFDSTFYELPGPPNSPEWRVFGDVPVSVFRDQVNFRRTNSDLFITLPNGVESFRQYLFAVEDVQENLDFSDVYRRNQKVIASNYNQNFYTESFQKIKSMVGPSDTTSYLLLATYYGLSLEYLMRHTIAPEAMVRTMLQPQGGTEDIYATLTPYLNSFLSPLAIENTKSLTLLEQVQASKDQILLNAFLFATTPFTPDSYLISLSLDEVTEYYDIAQLQSDALRFQELYYSLPEAGTFSIISGNPRSKQAFIDAGVSEDYIDMLSTYWRAAKVDDNAVSHGQAMTFSSWLKLGSQGAETLAQKKVKDVVTNLAYATPEVGNNPIATPSQVVQAARTFFGALIVSQDAAKKARQQLGEQFYDAAFNSYSQKLGANDRFPNPTQVFGRGSIANLAQVKKAIVEDLWRFRAFVYYFSEFAAVQESTGFSNALTEYIDNIKSSSLFDHKLVHNMKVFRDYHYITNDRDIICNDIAASTREMYNSVAIRYPAELKTSNDMWMPDFIESKFDGDSDQVSVSAETTWTTWPSTDDGHVGMQFDDSVTLQDKKLAVHTDLNVTRKEQAAMVGTNVLTKTMRPMYRNKLTILGRPIKPWDYIYLDDKYTDMNGMLDVERVVHHYSHDKGWTTNIIPHAACEANPGNRQIQAAAFATKMDRIYDLGGYVLNAAIIATAIPSGGASVAAATALRTAFAASSGTLGKKIGATLAKSSVQAQMRVLKKTLLSDSLNVLKAYAVGQGILYSGNVVTNLVHTNMRAGSDNLPVLFMPIMYKGIPLEAGIHGTEFTYWSLGSKLHWARKHFTDGVRSFFESLDTDRTPELNSIFKAIELQNGLNSVNNDLLK